MKVILLERVGKHGHIGDEVTVKDGYARNFLLPQHKALRATEANRKKFEVERASIEKRNADRREAAAGIAAGLNGQTVVIIRQAGETGQLYGSVSSRDVAEALTAAGFQVARSDDEAARQSAGEDLTVQTFDDEAAAEFAAGQAEAGSAAADAYDAEA
jgi:large subunit ribosomal protein L9